MAHVKKNARKAIAELKVGQAAVGSKGCLKVVSLSWAKKKKETGKA